MVGLRQPIVIFALFGRLRRGIASKGATAARQLRWMVGSMSAFEVGGRRLAVGGAAAALALALTCALPQAAQAAEAKKDIVSFNPYDPAFGAGDYVIGPGDKLKIIVFEVKDLSPDETDVDASGLIDFPLVGKVKAAGQTVQQLEADLRNRLDKYLNSPVVSVTVADAANEKVSIEGEVKTPGVYKLIGRTTLTQAIAMGGGPDDFANEKKVEIIRMVDGQQSYAFCNYSAIKAGHAADPVLEGNDIVVVGNSPMREAWAVLLKNSGLLFWLAYVK